MNIKKRNGRWCSQVLREENAGGGSLFFYYYYFVIPKQQQSVTFCSDVQSFILFLFCPPLAHLLSLKGSKIFIVVFVVCVCVCVLESVTRYCLFGEVITYFTKVSYFTKLLLTWWSKCRWAAGSYSSGYFGRDAPFSAELEDITDLAFVNRSLFEWKHADIATGLS